MTQAELKEKYMNIISTDVWANSPKMQEYARKEFCYGIELENEDIVVIAKPRIKKDFCFGYGMYGVSTEEDWDGANRMARHAASSEEYFLKENLKEINERIDRLHDPRFEGYKYCSYSGQPHKSKLKSYTLCSEWDNPSNAPYRWTGRTDVEKLTRSEIQALIAGYEKVKEMFIKRLKTYLKRYGLSKVTTWSYLRD